MQKLLKKHAEKIRFGIVGVVNTIIDFVILFTLVALGLPAIASNFISTSAALIFSFFANKKFTFKHVGKNTNQQIAYFFLITIFGLWVIQPVIIEIINLMLGPWFLNSQLMVWTGSLLGSWFKASYFVLLIGKCLATLASLIWNYMLYRKFVFKK